jgi:hypothetical protein
LHVNQHCTEKTPVRRSRNQKEATNFYHQTYEDHAAYVQGMFESFVAVVIFMVHKGGFDEHSIHQSSHG